MISTEKLHQYYYVLRSNVLAKRKSDVTQVFKAHISKHLLFIQQLIQRIHTFRVKQNS